MNFIGSAVAQTTTTQATSTASAPSMMTAFMDVVPFLLIFVVFYFFILRPQQKRVSQHKAKIESVKRGDSVVTAGGIVGKVIHVREQEVEVEIAPEVRVKVVKNTLSDVSAKGL